MIIDEDSDWVSHKETERTEEVDVPTDCNVTSYLRTFMLESEIWLLLKTHRLIVIQQPMFVEERSGFMRRWMEWRSSLLFAYSWHDRSEGIRTHSLIQRLISINEMRIQLENTH